MSKDILKAEYGAPDKPLRIGDIEIPCYVLEDGRRVIVQRGLYKALGVTRGGAGSDKYREYGGGARLVSFLDQIGLMSLKNNDLGVALKTPIIFQFNKTNYYGYEATLLQDIVRAISKAHLRGTLPKKHSEIGHNAELLDDAFAKVGIIALVDEATGYQHKREQNELQKILKAYISPELLPWQKRFPDEFYQEIFRLNGWDYTVKGIQNRPGVIGIWTKQLIYNLLPKGVVSELEKKVPRSKAGNKTVRLHQGLTLDIGEPHLEKQLLSIITLMNVSNTWPEFIKLFGKKYGQTMMDLPEIRAQEKADQKREADKGIQTDLFDMQLKALLSTPPPQKDKE